ncbi:hypothetical protein ACFU5N_25600 [Streptomyces albidoflavus]
MEQLRYQIGFCPAETDQGYIVLFGRAEDAPHGVGEPVRTAQPPVCLKYLRSRETLREAVRRAVAGADSEEEFFTRLREAGVRVKLRHAPSGGALGCNVALPGDRNRHREPIWYPGPRLAPDLSLSKIRLRLTDEAAKPSASAVAADQTNWSPPARQRRNATATLVSTLVLVTLAAARWYSARGHAQQAHASRQAAAHLRNAYRQATTPMRVLHDQGRGPRLRSPPEPGIDMRELDSADDVSDVLVWRLRRIAQLPAHPGEGARRPQAAPARPPRRAAAPVNETRRQPRRSGPFRPQTAARHVADQVGPVVDHRPCGRCEMYGQSVPPAGTDEDRTNHRR